VLLLIFKAIKGFKLYQATNI